MAEANAQVIRKMRSYMEKYDMSLKAIFAVDESHCLGYGDNLIFKNPRDLQFFREKTINSAVIMGRKTFDSLGRRPLKNRLNIVITHDPEGEKAKFKEAGTPGAQSLRFLNDYEKIPFHMRHKNLRTGWVIGGAKVLEDLHNMCAAFLITEYRCDIQESGQKLGLLPPDKPDEDEYEAILAELQEGQDPPEYYDPKKLVRIGSIIRRIKTMCTYTKLTPTGIFTAPNGNAIRYSVAAYIRPNPKAMAKLIDMRAKEALQHETDRALEAEAEIRQQIRGRF